MTMSNHIKLKKNASKQLKALEVSGALDYNQKQTIKTVYIALDKQIKQLKKVGIKMTKFYVNELANVLGFDGEDLGINRDDKGLYVDNKDQYDWLVELDHAIKKLEDNGINTLDLQVNEYQDYVIKANQL